MVIIAALLFSLVPAASGEIVYLQTIGGAFIMQTLPAVYLALYTRKLNKYPVAAGWLVGLTTTIVMLAELNFTSSLYKNFDFVYIGVFALVLNLVVVGIGMAVMKAMNKIKDEGIIENSEFEDIE